jgi:5-oxoprolinase (ATP-hydrolysing)/N-methylhydantoinase A
VNEDWIRTVSERFHAAHEQAHLRRFQNKPVVLINVRVSGVGHVPRLRVPDIEAGGTDVAADALLTERKAHFPGNHGVQVYSTRFYSRPRLRAGNLITGPAVIEQSDTTTVLPPGARARVDRYGNLIVTPAAGEAGSP